MSKPMISNTTHNAISSLASEDGAMHSGLQDGMMIDLFGQEVVLANLSATAVKKKLNQMSVTYGRIGIGSSSSQRLQLFLESKLTAQLPMGGLTRLRWIWRKKTTPSLRRSCQLVHPGRRILEKEFGLLLTTPQTRENPRSKKRSMDGFDRMLSPIEYAAKMEGGKGNDINPLFLCWLMGFPEDWERARVMATQSYRK